MKLEGTGENMFRNLWKGNWYAMEMQWNKDNPVEIVLCIDRYFKTSGNGYMSLLESRFKDT
jgi:hypothetical protein